MLREKIHIGTCQFHFVLLTILIENIMYLVAHTQVHNYYTNKEDGGTARDVSLGLLEL
jgi:hypothetical protein